ncbi:MULTISPECIES: helix-turn-helix transcriptional regulator [unclassified Pseudomonas]|uniref:helix-turn-helix transcriptional regulator n=1 Tax=unclassified Pseudomonas TaxID=196821 RepID=UPI00244C1C3A|nr:MULTISPECIES: helix-turn-helix transcriptional regulator [unclassified Pseudomonas]MDG9929383.1 helix-turn-helix transcriptional regulator [Pseudomonas sp. GD04042]MDH0481641.1 helix-turn-helix transcriptional regulator [Pseudomonas sp. GD04015]MDH0603013.1 helix-turn-helix transcriptional regulator [Pseudomonas sp. GD03869]
MGGEAYDELVSLIYECVLDESAWLTLLGRLATATGRREGTLLFWDQNSGQAPRLITLCSQESQREYDSLYVKDPTAYFMARRQVGSWYHDVEEYGLPRMARDPFYQEFMRSHGQKSMSCIKLYEQGSVGAYLTLLTALDARAPDESHQRILQHLSVHLRQAARMSECIRRLELDVAQHQLLLEQSTTPQWLVNAEGTVAFCNAAAERCMGRVAFPLRLLRGRLVADGVPALAAMFRIACGKSGPSRASWLRLPRTSAELLITPVKSEGRCDVALQSPLVLVALLESRTRVELLAELFQLTPAESRLAGLIAQGLSPEDCAARLGVSINTVRSQLRSLFRKTDTERQVELAGLLVRLG